MQPHYDRFDGLHPARQQLMGQHQGTLGLMGAVQATPARDRDAAPPYEAGQNGLSSNDNGGPERDRRLVGGI